MPERLAGRVVLVTREDPQPLVTLLRARGATARAFAAVRTEPGDAAALGEALARGCDWVVVTSPRGASLLDRALGAKVSAIGDTTAAALARRGIAAAFVPSAPDGATLGRELPLPAPDADARRARSSAAGRGGAPAEDETSTLTGAPRSAPRVVLLRSDLAHEALPDALRERGAEVVDVIAYRTVTAGPERRPEALAALRGCDTVTFTSGSAARGLLDALGDAAPIRDVVVACLGPTTAADARALGLRVDVVAPSPTLDALLDALAAHLAAMPEEVRP